MKKEGVALLNQQEYIKYANKTFKGKALELVLKNIELFYDDTVIKHIKKYSIGDEVKLSKGTFIHGIPGMLDNFDWIIKNGFLAVDFTESSEDKNKIKNSIGMWNIKNDMLLKDYINSYSGFTISYSIGRGPGSKTISKLIPYHKFDELTEEINNNEEIWTYWGDQTKEVRLIPSLVSNKRQIAFILNMDSEYAKKLAYNDVWNLDFD